MRVPLQGTGKMGHAIQPFLVFSENRSQVSYLKPHTLIKLGKKIGRKKKSKKYTVIHFHLNLEESRNFSYSLKFFLRKLELMGRIRISGENVNRGPKEQYQQLGFSISRCADKRLVIFSNDTPNMEVIGKYLMEHLCLKSESWKSLSQPCPCLLPSQGNGLWLLERTLQSCRRPWELNIRLPG